MSAKVQPPQDNTGSSVLSQMPPSVSLASNVLASSISLPESTLIVYHVFTCPPATTDSLDHLESARRRVLYSNKGKAFLDSLHPIVHITKDVCALYVFALASSGHLCSAQDALAKVVFDNLALTGSGSFPPTAIYPCSPACSVQDTPCSHCLEQVLPPPSASPSQLLPRVSLRLPLALFLRATRDRLIDDVAEASKLHSHGRSVTRLKGGFLLGSLPSPSEWGSGWEGHARSRPLIACDLQIHIASAGSTPSSSRLVIHPIMRATYYLPLRSVLPLPAGTPIVLLPHGIPAYYLNAYSGPATALAAQFEDMLLGTGVGKWKTSTLGGTSEGADARSNRNSSSQEAPLFVIAWLAVQNKQGEDKGMPIVWPASLCVSYHASSPSLHARTPLPYIPELPSQLQSSPPPPMSAIPSTFSFATAGSSAIDIPARASTPQSQGFPATVERDRLSSAFQRRPSLLRSSPTSDSLRAFRTLTLARKPYGRQMKTVASEVSGYVESVVKDRERERERLRRERQEQDQAHQRAKFTNTQPQPATEARPSAPALPEPAEPSQLDPAVSMVTADPAPPLEIAEPEPQPSADSDDSGDGDSLFSPPDANIDLPSTEEESSAVVETTPTEQPESSTSRTAPVAPTQKAEADPSSMTFDPFSGFDNSWGQQPSGYLDSNMYDMDFNMNMDTLGGGRTGGAGASGSFDMDDGFGVFTEDDFDFFDAPSTQRGAAPAPAIPGETGSGLTPAAGPPPLRLTPLVGVDGPLSGPGPPSANANHSSPWVNHLGDPFTPRNVGDIHGMIDSSMPPELLPSSPTRTPSSHSAPATPSVQLSEPYRTHEGRKSSVSSVGSGTFDPIPFASSHRLADGKYAVGKFALPSPPADQDRAEVAVFNASGPPSLYGWKRRYSAVTDPRIGVVRKLIGVKRKGVEQGVREQRRSSAWDYYREPEEWQSSSPPEVGMAVESDESDEEEDNEPWAEDEEMVSASAPRPSTPPPSYLPLGPTLLQTHFHHAHLLPLCTNLRPPGATAASPPGSAPLMSVPTPVSPAAILGAASEKSKSLEAAAQILVKEIVENPVWAEAWRANASLSLSPPVLPSKLWQADARYIGRLLGGGADMHSPATVRDVFGQPSGQESTITLRSLEPPMLAVGKDEAIIQIASTSLRFWEKLGLTPRAGPKNVTAFVFYEGADEEHETEIEAWLMKVSAAYSAKNFGSHDPGISSHCTKPGLVPTRFETLRKTLISFVSTIPTHNPYLVFYIATPSNIISPSSTVLRQILSAVRRFRAQSGGDVLVHFVPESLIEGIHTHPASNLGGLDDFVCSVYDRILVPVTRAMSREFFVQSAVLTGFFEAPAYALVGSASGKTRSESVLPQVSFALESSVSSLDVMNRHLLLHVGYQVSSCGRWILAACVDAAGEAHEIKAFLTPDDNVEAFVVSQVWSFAREFARRANIEWRIVVSKLGIMAHSEIDAWASHLDSAVSMSSEVPPMHVTLLAVDNESSWTFLASPDRRPVDIIRRNSAPAALPRSPSRTSHAIFSDASYSTYSIQSSQDLAMYPSYIIDRSAKFSSPGHTPGSCDLPYIPDLDDDTDTPSHQSLATDALRVPGWSTVVCAPSATDHTAVSTVHVYQLHVTRSLRSTYEISKKNAAVTPAQIQADHMDDIVRNFHDLAVLARTRWKLGADPALPFHLAALEVMRAALNGGTSDS